MVSIFSLLAVSLVLAFLSQKNILTIFGPAGRKFDAALVLLIIMLSFYGGLRTNYNDTATYISGFNNTVTWQEFWSTSHNILGNVGFYAFQAFFHQYISGNYHLFFVVVAFFVNGSYLFYIRKRSENFIFSILIFFCIGLYISQFAAMKQHIAMAILVLALPRLEKRQYFLYYLLVFIAMLFHSYAIFFVIMPLFLNRPWKKITYLTIICVVFILFTFESSITGFLETAEALGKDISESEVFDTAGINLFRLTVYAVLPVMSFCFQKYLRREYNRETSLMMNMSILSFLVMCLGLVSGGNLFGRCAIYFEIGTVTVFPWLLHRVFNRRSYEFIIGVASVCFLIFFYMDVGTFASEFTRISISEFFNGLF